LEDAKLKHEQEKIALQANLLAATNAREGMERKLREELAAQKAANLEIQQEAQRKQAVLDKMIDSEKQRAIEHEKTMAQLHTLEISDEEKAKLLAKARSDIDQSNEALHVLEQKLLEELAKERAAANKLKAETDEVKKERDATEKARRQIAGELGEASRQNSDLAKRLDDMAADKDKVLAVLRDEKKKRKKINSRFENSRKERKRS